MKRFLLYTSTLFYIVCTATLHASSSASSSDTSKSNKSSKESAPMASSSSAPVVFNVKLKRVKKPMASGKTVALRLPVIAEDTSEAQHKKTNTSVKPTPASIKISYFPKNRIHKPNALPIFAVPAKLLRNQPQKKIVELGLVHEASFPHESHDGTKSLHLPFGATYVLRKNPLSVQTIGEIAKIDIEAEEAGINPLGDLVWIYDGDELAMYKINEDGKVEKLPMQGLKGGKRVIFNQQNNRCCVLKEKLLVVYDMDKDYKLSLPILGIEVPCNTECYMPFFMPCGDVLGITITEGSTRKLKLINIAQENDKNPSFELFYLQDPHAALTTDTYQIETYESGFIICEKKTNKQRKISTSDCGINPEIAILNDLLFIRPNFYTQWIFDLKIMFKN
jgi:hypothetical protein